MDKPIHLLIVEDDMIIAADIAMQLTNLGYEVNGIVPRGEMALKAVADKRPDLILMDINLKGELDGIQTASAINEQHRIPIIYLTANTDDATFNRAKATAPHAFLSKPFNLADLQHAIELAINRYQGGEEEKPDTNTPDPAPLLTDRIFVRHKEKMVKLFIADILYMEADRSYCRIFTKDTEYMLSVPLKNLEEKLQHDNLFRVHRSYIINLHQLDEVAENHVIINQKVIPVSKSYKEAFLKRIPLI